MKIYLSKSTIKTITDMIDPGSATTDEEFNELEGAYEDLCRADENRDGKRMLTISRKTFDFLMAELDWIVGDWNRQNEENEK